MRPSNRDELDGWPGSTREASAKDTALTDSDDRWGG
jgi:hypothetical protein